MRDRLTERVGDGIRYDNGEYYVTCYPKNNNLSAVDKLAAKLCDLEDKIENGAVIVPPCKVGQTVYYIEGAYYKSKRQTVAPIKVSEISWKCDRSGRDLGFALIANRTRYKFSSIGKTVFLTREEAEKALAERSVER